MARWIALALLFAPFLLLCEARGQEPAYVSIVVKACPMLEAVGECNPNER
jgi:hypothetical protein